MLRRLGRNTARYRLHSVYLPHILAWFASLWQPFFQKTLRRAAAASVLYIPFMDIQNRVCYNLCDMKSRFSTKIASYTRRLLAAVLLLALTLSFQPYAFAENGLFSIGDCSDDVFRVETRLSDLGFLSAVVNGRWDQHDADALSAFAETNDTTLEASYALLFSSEALHASSVGHSVFAAGAQGFLITYGTRMPWEEVLAMLVPGTSYDVTSCYSGIALHMVFVSADGHAKMRPELDWDNATLRGFFGAESSSEKQPVVIAINGILIAASIQQAAPSMEQQPLPEYGLFFFGSHSGINGIPDAEHESIVNIAANQG